MSCLASLVSSALSVLRCWVRDGALALAGSFGTTDALCSRPIVAVDQLLGGARPTSRLYAAAASARLGLFAFGMASAFLFAMIALRLASFWVPRRPEDPYLLSSRTLRP